MRQLGSGYSLVAAQAKAQELWVTTDLVLQECIGNTSVKSSGHRTRAMGDYELGAAEMLWQY